MSTKAEIGKLQTFKRTEFFGDAIVRVLVIDYLIRNGFNRRDVNILTGKCVSNAFLKLAATKGDISTVPYLRSKKKLADMYEYVVAKKFLKRGYEHSYSFIEETLIPVLIENNILPQPKERKKSAKKECSHHKRKSFQIEGDVIIEICNSCKKHRLITKWNPKEYFNEGGKGEIFSKYFNIFYERLSQHKKVNAHNIVQPKRDNEHPYEYGQKIGLPDPFNVMADE